MDIKDFVELATEVVAHYHNENVKDEREITKDDVHIVRMRKTSRNYGALLNVPVSNGICYVFSWNGEKNEGRLGIYEMQGSISVKPESEGEA